MSRRKVLLTSLAASVAVSVPAFAFFSLTSGSSTASFSAADLAVTSASGTGVSTTAIDVSWVAPGSNPTGTQYKVVRDGSTTVCTQTSSPCHDTGLAAGSSHSYTVAAVLGSNWQSPTASTGNVSTVVAPSHAFTVSASTATPTAGTSFTVTITAKNNGSTDATYTGNKTLDWSGGQTIGTFAPTYPSNPVSFSSGVATVSVTLFKAGAQTLSVTDHADATYSGSSSSLTVGAGQPALFFSVACSSFSTQKASGNSTNGQTQTAITRGTDTWGNSVAVSGTPTVSLTTGTAGHGSWTGTASFANGSSTSTNTVTWTNGSGNSDTESPTANATGFVSATCSYTNG